MRIWYLVNAGLIRSLQNARRKRVTGSIGFRAAQVLLADNLDRSILVGRKRGTCPSPSISYVVLLNRGLVLGLEAETETRSFSFNRPKYRNRTFRITQTFCGRLQNDRSVSAALSMEQPTSLNNTAFRVLGALVRRCLFEPRGALVASKPGISSAATESQAPNTVALKTTDPPQPASRCSHPDPGKASGEAEMVCMLLALRAPPFPSSVIPPPAAPAAPAASWLDMRIIEPHQQGQTHHGGPSVTPHAEPSARSPPSSSSFAQLTRGLPRFIQPGHPHLMG